MQDYEPQGTWTPGPPVLATDPLASTSTVRRPAKVRRLMAAGLLALGMLAGGAAIVSAASPNPSAAPNASGGTSGGQTTPGYNAANCPNM